MGEPIQGMNVLVLTNSQSPGYAEGREAVVPYLEHFGLPYVALDLASDPLPGDISEYALIVVAHRELDPQRTRLDAPARGALLGAVGAGAGLVSFDPRLPAPAELDAAPAGGGRAEARELEFGSRPHYITSRHSQGEVLPLVGPLRLPALGSPRDQVLVWAAGRPLLAARALGSGRLVQWASAGWMHSRILGPLAGLDDVLWRSLVWAARKPFALRGLAPLVAMRVDDVAGRGGLWHESPLYWAHAAVRHGFKPWLGLFIYNLTETAVAELGELLGGGQATAFPHAFGRPPRAPGSDYYYYERALPLRATDYDEFIYFDHHCGRPWPDDEAARGLRAVEEWYAAHGPLPMSPCALPHWYEMGPNVLGHLQDRWGAEFVGTPLDTGKPLSGRIPWLKAGPFRCYEKPGACFMDLTRRAGRPVYYAGFVNLGGRRFFNCLTEIRDDAGYEWAPTNDVAGTVGRGVRQLRRALDSMALAVLFTHETDYIHSIRPDIWAKEVAQIAAGVAEYGAVFVTLEEGMRYVRATHTSRLMACSLDPKSGQVAAVLTGQADVATHLYLFEEESGEVRSRLVEVPAFGGQVVVRAVVARPRT